MLLRSMNVIDADAVFAIECAAREFPWSLSQFVSCVQSDNITTVLEIDNVICGFSVYQRVLDECSLLNIVVHPNQQTRGSGRFLLEYGLSELGKAGVKMCFLEVRVSNVRAQNLYLSSGFQQIGRRKNYYPGIDEREDALVMSRQLPQAVLEKI